MFYWEEDGQIASGTEQWVHEQTHTRTICLLFIYLYLCICLFIYFWEVEA